MRFILSDETIRYSVESPNTQEVGFYFLCSNQLELKNQLINDYNRIENLWHCEKSTNQK